MTTSHRVLGIDPGIASMGYGLIDDNGGDLRAVRYGCFSTSASKGIGERLRSLHRDLVNLIEAIRPSEVAIELFIARNLKAALSVGQARGVAILAAANAGLPVYEYTPNQVKQRVAGFGHGSKMQVQEMVRLQLGLEAVPEPDHAADALAVALCHLGEVRLAAIMERGQDQGSSAGKHPW